MLLDMRHHDLSAVDDAHQIDVHHPAPFVVVGLLNAAGAAAYTGVVDQHVNFAKALDGLIGQCLPLLQFGHIHLRGEYLNTGLL